MSVAFPDKVVWKASIHTKSKTMKHFRQSTLSAKFYFTAFILLSFTVLTACSRKIMFVNSAVVPAAEGSIKMKKDNNNNYSIDLSVIRLADPQRLSPAKKLYLVWMDVENSSTKNIGRLSTSSGLFSNTLKSSLQTVTAFKPVKIFITAEDDPGILYPAGQVVLTTTNF
jgi:hypothetical protein